MTNVTKFILGDGVLERIPEFVEEIQRKAQTVLELDRPNTAGIFRADFLYRFKEGGKPPQFGSGKSRGDLEHWFAYVALITASEQKLTGIGGVLISGTTKAAVAREADLQLADLNRALQANNPAAETRETFSDHYEVL